MQRNSYNDNRRRHRRTYLFGLVVLVASVAAAAFVAWPHGRFYAQADDAEEIFEQEKTAARRGRALENYDIRTDKKAFEKIARYRQTLKRNAAEVADLRDETARAETALKQKVPTLKIEYSEDLRAPEVIAPDVKRGRAFLSRPSNAKRSEILRAFARENKSLLGASDDQLSKLRATVEYTNPDGNLSFAHLEQFVGSIPVFRGEIKAGFTKSGEIVRVINNFAPGLDYENLSTDFGDPLDAVRAASRAVEIDAGTGLDLTKNKSASNQQKAVFGQGDWATVAEKIYFPIEPGVAIAAWRVLIWQPVNAYYVIVDAESGALLWRKNITEDQTQAATYNVYANPNAMINVADSPAPFSPGPLNPGLGSQGQIIGRTNVTLVGNETPYNFNNNGWIADNQNTTDGNAVEAGPDRIAPDGVDAPVSGGANRNFSFDYNPSPGSPPPGDDPLRPQSQHGAATQLFYVVNRFHDETYLLGFTEAARNFQHDNFGRGGLGFDRISAQSQDNVCAPPGTPPVTCANNANFATPADGARGRMQMYMWTPPTPDRDGALDAEIVIHELTHGLSSRLHNNAFGLTTNMARGMGEGWSDFYAHALLSEPGDPLNGIYVIASYSVFRPAFQSNYYYGIRRFPKALMAFTGGPNNRPHNPLTFADLDSSQFNAADGAFAPAFSSEADQVHSAGEIWSSALWEVRARYITRLGWPVGNRRILQHVTDAMKISPLNPTFIQARDAIIAAAQASLPGPQASADTADIWEGFRIRGMGFAASVENSGVGQGTARVTESFAAPNLLQTPSITVSDADAGDNDGFAEPGEIVTISVPLRNETGTDAAETTLQLVGSGQTADYGTVLNNSTVTKSFNYTVPFNSACGGTLTLTFNLNSSLGPATVTRSIIVGVPNQTFAENFDAATAPNFPAGWTTSTVASGVPFVVSTVNPDSVPNAAFVVNISAGGGGADLTSPEMPINAASAIVSFRHSYDTEASWDGAALEISVAGGAFQDILTAGSRFVEGGYNDALGANAENNPLAGRRAWTGSSGGYITTKAVLPAAAAGQNVRLRWRFGADDNTAGIGWRVDTIQVVGSYGCALNVGRKKRADFDGDGKTDLAVFRPSEAVWYLNRSSAGFTAARFGLADDILTPGDFDGDGKTDIAVFRPSEGVWYRLNSSDGAFAAMQFGKNGDIPQAGDFDGDGKDDLSVFRPSVGDWFRLNSSNGAFVGGHFGQAGDLPVAGDYDGDGKDDAAVYRPSEGVWYRLNSSDGAFATTRFGLAEDMPVHADYDGDRREDIALWRPSDGVWYWLKSSDGQFAAFKFGQTGDVPAPGDYDGDGRDDQAIYRNGEWFLNRSTAGFAAANFGLPNDRVVPKHYIP